MVSFGFKRSCPLVGITQRRLPGAPVPIEVGRHYDASGARFRREVGHFTALGRKGAPPSSKGCPINFVTPPHFHRNE